MMSEKSIEIAMTKCIVWFYDGNSRTLQVQVNLIPFEDIPKTLQLSVMITEDHLVDPQADRAEPTGIVKDYEHNHVLRTMLTSPEGDDLGSNHIAFVGSSHSYTFSIPESTSWWKVENLNVISFIALRDGESREVIQVKESPVLP